MSCRHSRSSLANARCCRYSQLTTGVRWCCVWSRDNMCLIKRTDQLRICSSHSCSSEELQWPSLSSRKHHMQRLIIPISPQLEKGGQVSRKSSLTGIRTERTRRRGGSIEKFLKSYQLSSETEASSTMQVNLSNSLSYLMTPFTEICIEIWCYDSQWQNCSTRHNNPQRRHA